MKTLSATDTLVAAPEDGASVTVTSIMYATGTDGATPPTSGWSSDIPSVPEGRYLWTKISFSSGDPAYMVSRQMYSGTSVWVSSIQYAVGSSATSHPTSGWSTTFPTSIGQGKYLWVWTVYSDGTSAYSVSFQGNDGENVTVVSTAYAVSTSGTTIPSSGWSTSIPSVSKGSYLWTRVKFSNGEYSYTCAYHGKDGSNGNIGATGPSFYMAGVYSDTTYYTRDSYKAPVVLLDGYYYAKIKTGSHKGVNPKTDVANNGGYWAVFDMFKYIFSEVAFIEFGKLASAIFNGDFMFSQYGVNSSGESNQNYTSFDPSLSDPTDNADFMPNILMNMLTGEAWLNNVHVKGEINAESGTIGGFTIDTDSIYSSASVLGATMEMKLSPQNIQFSYSDGLAAGVAMDAVFGPVQTYINGEGTMTSGVKISNMTGKASSQIGLHLAVKSGYNIYAEGGSCFLLPSVGNMTRIQGFSLYGIKSTSGALTSDCDFIKATGDITLPSAATMPGKIIFVKMMGEYKISSSSKIYQSESNETFTSETFQRRSVFFISDGSAWHEFVCYNN